MAPNGTLETVGPVASDDIAPAGMTLPSSMGAGATDSASDQLGGTDNVPSEAA